MTKIVHEFCGICIQRRDIAGCFSGVWSGGLRFGEESCLCIAARLRGIAGWQWGRVTAPTVRRLLGGVRTEDQPRSALRLFFASRFARLRGIACSWWGWVAGPNHSPPARRRTDRGTASLGAPAVFCIALCAIARHSRAGKKNGSRQGQRLPGAMLPFRFLTP